MKKIILLWSVILLNKVLCAQSFTANFTTATGDIPASSTSLTCFPLTVSGVGVINNTKGLEQICINITHNELEDLEILLQAPDGTYIPLTVQNGGTANNYTNTCFTSTATTPIKFGTAPFTGSYLPEGYLGAANNGQNANATWNLCIRDRRDPNTSSKGNLNSYTLTFSTTPAPPAPPVPTAADCKTTIPSSNTCASATPVCDFNGMCGGTINTTPNTWPQLTSATCFGINNNVFVKFVATASTASFNVWIPTSTGGNDAGLQMLFFSGVCDGAVTTYGCYEHIYSYTGSKPLGNLVSANGLTPGNTYYLMIDGLNGAVTTFTLTAASGINILNIDPPSPTICAGQNVGLTASGGNNTYSWSPAGSLSASSGTTVTASPASTTTYTVTSATPSGCPLTKDVTVTVGPPPAAPTVSSPVTYCQNAAATPLTATGTNLLWYTAATGGTGSSTAPTPNTSAIGSTTYYVSQSAGSCEGPRAAITVDVTTALTPVTSFSYDKTSACANDAVNPVLQPALGFTAGGTFTVSPSGLTINSSTGAINIATSSAGNYTITYSVSASGCNGAASNTANFEVYTNTTPITGFRYLPATVCAGGSNPTIDRDLAFASGGVYSAQPNGLDIDPNTGAINVAASTAGTYTITYDVAASGCTFPGTNTTTFTINPSTQPVTGFSYTPNAICLAGANPTLSINTGFRTGGTFTVSPTTGLNIDPSTGAINVAASSAGTYTVTYSVTANGCSPAGSSNTTITINSNITPVTDFSYSAAGACKNGGNPTIFYNSGFTTGGAFSATPAGLSFNTTTGDIDVAASNPGNYTITYSVAASGCVVARQSQANFSIYTNTTPITGFRYLPATVCTNATNPALDKDLAFTTGGTYTSNAGLAIDQNTGAIDVISSTPGTYTITYTVNASGCTLDGSGTTTFTINPTTTPVTGFSYSPDNVCKNAANPILSVVTGFTTGGTFTSAAGLVIDQNTGAIDVAASIAGTYTITYNVTSTGCAAANSGTATFTINDNITPVTGFSYTPNTICVGGSNPALNTDAGFATGGTFSTAPSGLSIDVNTGAINIAASSAGNYTITYSVTGSGCILPASSNSSVNITSPSPANVTFQYSSLTFCSIPTLITAAGFTTGGTFNAVPAGLNIDPATGIINPTGNLPGSYSVFYTVLPGGCTLGGNGSATTAINLASNAVTDFSYNVNSVCANGINPVLNTVAGFTTGGTFSAAPAGLNIDAATGAINVAASTAGSYTITYAVTASDCIIAGSFTYNFTIIANTQPVTTFSYTPNEFCTNSSNPTLVLDPNFTTGGTFSTVPTGLIINGTTGQLNIAASIAGRFTIHYDVPASGCRLQGSNTTIVNINPVLPPAVTLFSYESPVCKNNANVSPVTVGNFTTGGTYSSTTGLSINATTGIINLGSSTAGTYTVTYTIAATLCNPEQNGTATITINNTPLAPDVVNGKNCGPGTVTLTATGTTGTVNWYDDAALTNLVNTGNTYSPSLTTTAVYRVTETVGLCTSSPTIVTATIGEIPEPPFLGPDTSICEGDRLTLNAGSYANYTWQDGSGGSTFIVTTPGTYSVTVGNSAGCTNSSSINVTQAADCSDIYFPSAFAPDGKNNLFGPITPDGTIRGITRYSLTIYNRYGQIVFLSTNPTEKWDGTFKGKKMGVGTFVWYSSYLYRGRAMKKQKGSLVLIR